MWQKRKASRYFKTVKKYWALFQNFVQISRFIERISTIKHEFKFREFAGLRFPCMHSYSSHTSPYNNVITNLNLCLLSLLGARIPFK